MTTQTQIISQGDEIIVSRSQDVQPIIEHCKHLAEFKGSQKGQEMVHVAELPLVVIESYMNTHGIDMQEFMNNPAHIQRMITDPDLSKFRVYEGKV